MNILKGVSIVKTLLEIDMEIKQTFQYAETNMLKLFWYGWRLKKERRLETGPNEQSGLEIW